MYVVLAAAGNIGSEVVKLLAGKGEQVLGVVHSAQKAREIEADGIEPVVADLGDSDALRNVLQRGRRAFLLNPPGDTSGDSNAIELETGKSIAEALSGSGLEKVVVASTYGAQEGDAIGDLSTLWAFENEVKARGIPAAINRGAYYFTNFDMLLDAAREGSLPTFYPDDFVLPMVAPADLASAAVERLLSGVDDVGVVYVEAPGRYSFAQVADTFGKLLERDVNVVTTPRDKWEESYKELGFSDASARAFSRMAASALAGPELPENPWRGEVGLEDYLSALVKRTD